LHGSKHTNKAQHALQIARRKAGEMGSARINPEHLQLGILAADRPAVHQFISSDASDVVEQELRQQVGKGPAKIADDVDLPLSPQSKNILRLAAESARVASHRQVHISDLLVGVIREQRTLALQILQKTS
jgi:ATP-dependent Clp protease ATP-binding subunit ClpA